MAILSEQQAFQAAIQSINDRCQQDSVDPITSHDIPIIAAAFQFGKSYDRAIEKWEGFSPAEQVRLEEQFNREIVVVARTWICTAILAPGNVRRTIAADLV